MRAEEIIAGIWGQVLGRERVGRLENFFELGGHSLLATQVMARVRKALGVDVALRVLFEAPSVAGLGLRLSSAGAALRPRLVPMRRPAEIPLSYAQRRLWFLERLETGPAGPPDRRRAGEPQDGEAWDGEAWDGEAWDGGRAAGEGEGGRGGGTYVIPLAVRLIGALDRAALAAALCDLAGAAREPADAVSGADGRAAAVDRCGRGGAAAGLSSARWPRPMSRRR